MKTQDPKHPTPTLGARVRDLVRRGGAFGVAATLSLTPVVGRAEAPIDQAEAERILATVDKDIAQLKTDSQSVASAYGEPLTASGGATVERRLREGEIAFLLEDYLRASIILLDVVENPQHKSHPRYDDCLYFLAESLRRTENYVGAIQYFEDLLPRANGERLKDVVLGLLEIAGATGRYDRVEKHVTRLRQMGGLSRPEVEYIYAKTLASSGDPASMTQAADLLAKIGPGSSVSAKASYYAGAVLVALKRLGDAIPQFEEAIRRANTEEFLPIKELSHLALGRIYHESGDTAKAANAYQEVSRLSPQFSQALFETAWVYVRESNTVEDPKRTEILKRALETAELLMASGPDVRLFPEARILEGNLQIRLSAPEDAYDTFQSIVDRYGGARSRLSELIGSNVEARQLFEQMGAGDGKQVVSESSAAYIPPIALEWANSDPGMKRVFDVIGGLRQSRTQSDEANELVGTLLEALEGESKYAMFKGLASSRATAFGAENRVVLAAERLISAERRMLRPFLSPDELARLDAALAKRRSLEQQLVELPKTEEDVKKAEDAIRADYRAVETRVFKQSNALNAMKAQVAAVEAWLAANRDKLSETQRAQIGERLDASRKTVNALDAKLKALEADIRTASLVSGSDAGRLAAARLRAEYNDLLASEVEMLRSLRAKLPSGLQVLATRADGQRQQLTEVGAELRRLQGILDDQVNNRVTDLRRAIEAERDRLAAYQQDEGALSGQTDTMLGPVARSTLQVVANAFKDLVLRADVGIIDVAWARKQRAASQVASLVREQRDREQELESEFSQVLEEE